MEKEEEKKPELKLDSKVAEKFDLVGVKPGTHRFPQFGEIDLTALTLEDAKALVKVGFPYLKEKAKAKAEDPADSALPAKNK